jgi:hypothetical protein
MTVKMLFSRSWAVFHLSTIYFLDVVYIKTNGKELYMRDMNTTQACVLVNNKSQWSKM